MVGVVLADIDRFEESVDVLHVGDVAAESDDGIRTEDAETLDVCESGERAVGS